jgi:hypothetical protein
VKRVFEIEWDEIDRDLMVSASLFRDGEVLWSAEAGTVNVTELDLDAIKRRARLEGMHEAIRRWRRFNDLTMEDAVYMDDSVYAHIAAAKKEGKK